MCGSFARLHCGQIERAGTSRRQLEARRLRLLALEVFFLGTGMRKGMLHGTPPLERIRCEPAQRRTGGPESGASRRREGPEGLNPVRAGAEKDRRGPMGPLLE